VTPLELPVRILERVIRTQSQEILDDARGRNEFDGDEYIGRKQVRSLLCLPLLKQAELTGVLYFENSLASHVFTPARIAVLKLLASQAAIALENARRYRDVAEREAKIRRLVDANIIGIFISNGKEKIIEANDAFLRMLGYDRKDLALGRIRWTDLTAPEWRDRNSQMIEEVKTTGIAQPHENEYLRKDGSRVPVLVGAASFEKTENQRVAFVLDVTERRRAEEALRELESDFAHTNRVSMLGELAASLSHEIAQPISSVRNNARAAQNFLGMEPSDLGEVREALASVVADTDRVGEIIDRVREQIKKAPTRKERFDLNSAINEVITLARSVTNRNSVLIETRLADKVSVVHGDRDQLQQVLLNLILNAVEAMGAVDTGARELLISTERQQARFRAGHRSHASRTHVRGVLHYQVRWNRDGAVDMPVHHRSSWGQAVGGGESASRRRILVHVARRQMRVQKQMRAQKSSSQIVGRESRVKTPCEISFIHWFAEVARDPVVQGAGPVNIVRESSYEYCRNGVAIINKAPIKLDTCHRRHVNVGDQTGRFAHPGRREKIGRRRKNIDHKAH